MPSEIADDLGDAGAVTPSLFLGNTLPAIAHYVLVRAQQVPDAVSYIEEGGSVLTPNPALALLVLISMGMDLEEAQEKITRANSVLDLPFDLDF